MTDQVKRALELVDFWRNQCLNNADIFNTIKYQSPSNSKFAAQIVDFFSKIIYEIKSGIADKDTIKKLLSDDMNSILVYKNYCDDEKAFLEIENFLK